LQPTALVNEAFLRLVNIQGIEWQDRAHFFALCAQMMRRILVNYAVARATDKRGGGTVKVSLDEAVIATPEHDAQLLALDRALDSLAKFAPRMAQIVEMRFFAGLNAEESAAVLGVSPKTVQRDWNFSKPGWPGRSIPSPVDLAE
jgi:RNA polymerase sigma factor (TIGR02999 family)